MSPDQKAVVKALVVVAWADGVMHEREAALLDALIAAFELSSEDAAWARAYASTPRTLAELPDAELGHDERRLLLQHAITLIHADGVPSDAELRTLRELAERLVVPAHEAEQIIAAAARRARRLPALR